VGEYFVRQNITRYQVLYYFLPQAHHVSCTNAILFMGDRELCNSFGMTGSAVCVI